MGWSSRRAALGALMALLTAGTAAAEDRVAQLTQVDDKVTIARAGADKIDEARQLGAILGGAYERPKIVEELEMALGEL